MRKKEILLVSYDYFPNIGGVAVYTHELSQALAKRGHTVTILTSYFSKSNEVKLTFDQKVAIFRIPIPRIKKIGDAIYQKKMSSLIQRLQEEKKIDVIHWQTLNKDAKMMKRVNVEGIEIYTNHLSWFRTLFNQKKYKKIVKMIGQPDKIICPSREVEAMSGKLVGFENCVFIPNGVRLETYKEKTKDLRSLKKKLGISLQDKILVTTNRMEPVKGMTYFIKAIPKLLEQHPNTCICLIGDGSQEKELKAWLNKQSINQEKVKFLGRKENHQIKQYLELADIYIQPSLMEGCSIGILEAMACGNPVIACDIGGNPDVIEDKKSGLLIQDQSVSAIYEAVHYLLCHPDVAEKMGKQAKLKIEGELNWEKLAQKVDKIYEDALQLKKNEF